MSKYPVLYDHAFQEATRAFFATAIDWHWLKAQGIAESGLKPFARSPVGAMGIMQLMPATWQEVHFDLNLADNPFFPQSNIQAGVYYLARMFGIWKRETGLERLRFAFASYNAGVGNILQAQKLANGADTWTALAPVLDQVTGRNATETINYESHH